MRALTRWLFRFLILGLVLCIGVVVVKDSLLKSALEQHIRRRTGMDVKIRRFETGLLTPTVNVENVTIYNRAEFGGAPFLEIPDLYVEWDPGALMRGQLYVRLLRVTVAELNIVEGQNGRTNLVLALDEPAAATLASGPLPRVFGMDFIGIGTLNLTLGTIRFASLKRPGHRAEVQAGMKNEIVTNVRSLADLNAVVTRVLFQQGITIIADAPRNAGGIREASSGAPQSPTERPRRKPKSVGP